MLDIGWTELFVIVVVALLVIGPKDLPRAVYTVGKWVRKVRRITTDFQRHVDDMVREAELEDVRKGVQQARSLNIKRQIENTVDPGGELRRALDQTTGSVTPAAKAASPAAAVVPVEGAVAEPGPVAPVLPAATGAAVEAVAGGEGAPAGEVVPMRKTMG